MRETERGVGGGERRGRRKKRKREEKEEKDRERRAGAEWTDKAV